MKCVYANWHDGNPPCCTHDCEGCVWRDEYEAEEDECENPVVSVEENSWGTTYYHADGDYTMVSKQTRDGLFKHFNKEDEQ